MTTDSTSTAIDSDLARLLAAIRRHLSPRAVWLFGSRARGDHHSDSDWDLIVALPDDVAESALDPIVGWSIRQEAGVPATILTAREGELAESWNCPNTLGYALAREGRRIDVQGA
ncbi:nucleotidyltransferase domain-containing protein [Methylorubrum podarium]